MLRLAIRVRAADAELVLAELLELAPGGVEEVGLPGGIVEYAVYGPPGELPELPDLRAAAAGALVEIATTEVADDWAERWRQFHRPLVLGDRLTVRPPWEPPSHSAIDVVIDPGQAFGTGAHATTRLCLELMLEAPPSGAFLDIGCGSGVLAIVAAKLGCHPVRAVDNDRRAVAIAAANADRNGVEVDVRHGDVRHGGLPAAATAAANLLGPLLLDLARQIGDPLQAPHRLIAGGLLATEAEVVAAAFGRRGFAPSQQRVRGEWAALLLERG